ncbi:FAD/NAD(P)-binding domain-containing protein [Irpex lacteus]|nr:FAD/NAD(P)-binding domain-containing protein [Irpex lacteus]
MGTQPRFSVAIIGGGIGGFAFAIALGKTGAPVDIDIYDSEQDLNQIGAGIGFWPRAWEIMKILGLEESLSNANTNAYAEKGISYYKGDQDGLFLCGQVQGPTRIYHRTQFLSTLQSHFSPNTRIHYRKRLVSYEDAAPDPVVLHFADGTHAKCDLVIGADGTKSAVRKAMFESLASKAQDEAQAREYLSHVDAKWSGFVMYRALVQTDVLKEEFPNHVGLDRTTFFLGKQRGIICSPISQGLLVNVGAYMIHYNRRGTIFEGEWFSQASPREEEEEIVAPFAHWDDQALVLLQNMKGATKWVGNEVRGLPTYVSGRVALLGDAAHAMVPCLGTSANQALEDGFFLATLLGQPEVQLSNITTALQVYDEVRRPFTQRIQELSYEAGAILLLGNSRMNAYSAEDSVEGKIPENVLQEQIVTDMTAVLEWQWTTSLRPDITLALQKLRDALA